MTMQCWKLALCTAVFHAIGVTGFVRHDSDSLSSVALTNKCKENYKLVQKMYVSWYCKNADASKPCNQRYGKADTGKEYHVCADGGTGPGKGKCKDSGNKCEGRLIAGNYKAKFIQASWWLSTAGNYAGIIKFGLFCAFGAAAVTTPVGAVMLGLTILGMVGAAVGIISGVIALKDAEKRGCGDVKATVGVGLAATGLTTAIVVEIVKQMDPSGVAGIVAFFWENKGALGMTASIGGILNRGLTTKDPDHPDSYQHKMSVGVTKHLCEAVKNNVHLPKALGGQGVTMSADGTPMDDSGGVSDSEVIGKKQMAEINSKITGEPPKGLEPAVQAKMDLVIAEEKRKFGGAKVAHNDPKFKSLASPEVEAAIHNVDDFTEAEAELAGDMVIPDEMRAASLVVQG